MYLFYILSESSPINKITYKPIIIHSNDFQLKQPFLTKRGYLPILTSFQIIILCCTSVYSISPFTIFNL